MFIEEGFIYTYFVDVVIECSCRFIWTLCTYDFISIDWKIDLIIDFRLLKLRCKMVFCMWCSTFTFRSLPVDIRPVEDNDEPDHDKGSGDNVDKNNLASHA